MNLHGVTKVCRNNSANVKKGFKMEIMVPLDYLRNSNLFNIVKKGFLNEERSFLAKTPKGRFVDVKMTEGKIQKSIVNGKGHQVKATFSVYDDGIQLENITELTPRGTVVTSYKNNKPVGGIIQHGQIFDGFFFKCDGKITKPNGVFANCGDFNGRSINSGIDFVNDKESIDTFKDALNFIRGNGAKSAYK